MAVTYSGWDETADVEEGEDSDFASVSPDWDAEADFEEGDLTDFASTTTTGSATITANSTGPIRESWDCKCEATASGEQAYGELTLANDTHVVSEMTADFVDLNLADGDVFIIMRARGSGNGADAFQVEVRNNGGTLEARINYDDDTTTGNGGTYATVGNGSTTGIHYFRVVFDASSGPGNDDGTTSLYADGALLETISSIDNDGHDVDAVWYGIVASIDRAGDLFIDDCRWNDEAGSPVWIIPAAALNSSSFGMAVTVEDTTARYGELTGPAADTAVAVECEIDPNTLTMATDDILTFAECVGEFKIELAFDGTNYEVRATANLDSGTSSTARYNITDATHTVRVIWVASSSAGANDGSLSLYVDEAPQETLSGLDNDTLSVDEVRFGADDLDSGTSGAFYLDDMRWSDSLSSTFTPDAIALTLTLPAISFTSTSSILLPQAPFRDYSLVAGTERETTLTAPHRDYVLVAPNPREE